MGETCDWCGQYFPNRFILEVDSEDPHFIEPYCYICFACADKNPDIKVSYRPLDLGLSFAAAASNAGFEIQESPKNSTELAYEKEIYLEIIKTEKSQNKSKIGKIK